MGQYYIPLVGNAFGTNRKAFDRSIDGRYEVSKLLENSWYLNPFVNAISALFYSEASRLVWIGDYATEADDFYFKGSSAFCLPCYEEAWGEGVALIKTSASDFSLDGKFLLNYDTRQFVDLDDYKRLSVDKQGWCIHPLPLLTAVGNDRGSGDFHEGNVGYESVGAWAWHLLSIVDNRPKNFRKLKLVFKEII